MNFKTDQKFTWVFFSGAQSTGKTTLLNDVAEAINQKKVCYRIFYLLTLKKY